VVPPTVTAATIARRTKSEERDRVGDEDDRPPFRLGADVSGRSAAGAL